MFRRLISAAGQSRSAKTVEVFGWSRLRQLSLDTVQLACRTAKIVEENFYE